MACGCGAWIGAFVALEMSVWFWWVGALVGGVVGAVVYAWRDILAAIPRAWRATSAAMPVVRDWIERARALRLHEYYWREVVWSWTILLLCVAWISIAFTIMALIGTVSWHEAALGSQLCLTLYVAFGMIYTICNLTLGKIEQEPWTIRRSCRALFFASPLVVLCFWAPIGIATGLYCVAKAKIWVVTNIRKAIFFIGEFAARFLWEVFARVHSTELRLCCVDSMIGTTIGYFCGYPAVGAAFGFAFGYLNHAVVTNMWLRPRGYLPDRAGK
ncbi:MAG: hypothetical protein ABIA47_01265 [bacterium]